VQKQPRFAFAVKSSKESVMDASLFVTIFGAFSEDTLRKRRVAEWFRSVSVITGDEVLLKLPASPVNEDRRVAASRRSPDPSPLGLNG
jgi:hypothetical protein